MATEIWPSPWHRGWHARQASTNRLREETAAFLALHAAALPGTHPCGTRAVLAAGFTGTEHSDGENSQDERKEELCLHRLGWRGHVKPKAEIAPAKAKRREATEDVTQVSVVSYAFFSPLSAEAGSFFSSTRGAESGAGRGMISGWALAPSRLSPPMAMSLPAPPLSRRWK